MKKIIGLLLLVIMGGYLYFNYIYPDYILLKPPAVMRSYLPIGDMTLGMSREEFLALINRYNQRSAEQGELLFEQIKERIVVDNVSFDFYPDNEDVYRLNRIEVSFYEAMEDFSTLVAPLLKKYRAVDMQDLAKKSILFASIYDDPAVMLVLSADRLEDDWIWTLSYADYTY
ncbi:hypothetical protein [Entomospira culicis]|uniref:Uncharacterized protein n=1 Tax=Entomospira culicis TaxID=2719989 RepID=A0A968GDY9_9SPIO|nr:hypothetical protein [Entomospira culicis]NIZ18584.1 hypothetical protein [Entomospira culicis]NIZ68799.1 hypothetical protein [Entomospira culicis]WDI37394.1 hypothetical protein PVA46_00995 [Entomospira culicis]WDI39023.1 hypothetical protein PVA47_01005 [Entomospira culicis]